MCDYFYQRKENSQGDLADIVGSRRLIGPTETAAAASSWQFLPEAPAPVFPPLDDRVFGDSFADVADPLLHDLARTSFFDSPEAGGAQKKMVWEERNRPDGGLFSRMPQIPMGKGKGSPVIGPPPLIAAGGGGCGGGSVEISSPRLIAGIKRRKSQAKKVVCIPAPAAATGRPSGEVVPSDLWAWRKYGQKPIKGSPYPRGYYRCSSSKGCSARKQVERSRTDPTMLVITYTSDHNHPWPTQRNALAGSTRSQPLKANNASKQSTNNNLKQKPKEYCSSSKTQSGPLKQEARDHQDFDGVFDESFDEHVATNLNQPDDFFAGLAELEPGPMDHIFAKGSFMGHKLEEERDGDKGNKEMDPFINMLDWGGL